MYNHQLDTFILVAEEGSFSSAAQKLFISPSAVNQQISNLEDNLGTQLFYRSRQGIALTEAGKYLLSEIPSFIAYSGSIRQNLKQMTENSNDTLVVGIPHMHDVRLFYEYWAKYNLGTSSGSVHLISPNSWEIEDVFGTYLKCDLVEYIDIGAAWQKDRSFLKLEDVRVGVNVPKKHPLAKKKLITPEDLNGQELVTASGAFSNTIRKHLDFLARHGAKLSFAEHYSATLMDNCYLNNKLVVLLVSGRPIHHGFVSIPIDWDLTVPYGFSCKNPPSPVLTRFLDFVKKENRDF